MSASAAGATASAATLEERLAEAWKDSMAGKEVDLDAIWEEALAEGQGSFDNFGPMFGGQLNEEMFSAQMAGEGPSSSAFWTSPNQLMVCGRLNLCHESLRGAERLGGEA